jgi:hypothetical protein
MTLTALALTSAGRFWPLGPLGIFLLVDFDQTLIPGNPSLSGLDGGGSHVNALTNLKLEIRGLARLKVSKDQSIGLQLFTQVVDNFSEFAHDPMLFAKHGTTWACSRFKSRATKFKLSHYRLDGAEPKPDQHPLQRAPHAIQPMTAKNAGGLSY